MNDETPTALTHGSGSAVNIIMPGLKWQNGLIILALSLSLVSLYVVASRTNETEREARLSEYYAIEMETYIAKQGLKPPADPWQHQEEKRQ